MQKRSPTKNEEHESIYDILKTFNIEKNKMTQQGWINLLDELKTAIEVRDNGN